MSLLKKVYKKSSKSWDDIYESLLKIPKDPKHSEAGRQFETFSKHYYKILPEIKAVYFLEDAPPKLRKELNIEGVDDGVDLVIIDKRNRKIAVQVKFVKDQNKEISWSSKKLANTVGHRKFDAHWFFSNSKGICSRTKLHAKDPEQVFVQDLEDLSVSSIKRIISSIHSVKLPPKVFFKPKKHQEKAIKEVVKKFKTADRGQLILPCGAGKTLTSLWIKDKLKPKLTLVLVPSLSLLRQFKSSWLEQSKKDFDFFCVCSEKDVDKDTMSSRYEIGRTGLGVTTKPAEIREFVKKNKGNLVVFSTYQSSNKIQSAFKNTRIKFDLVVCDEAHRTATRHAANFAIVHDNKKIKALKRLYMTATPRIVSEELVRKQMDVTKYVADMSNSRLFGEELFRMSFAEAIKLGLLVDYKILAVGVTEDDVQKQIEERKYVLDKHTTVEDIANILALNKVIKKHKTSHALTFHSSIKRAESFRDKYKELFPRSWVDTVTGKQKTRDRKIKLNEYEGRAKGILTNARCLTEGIDISKIDCVYFCDPKNSKIDIVQACGRALRLDKTRKNKLGYIVCPIYHTKNCDDVDQFIKDSNFSNIIAILRAMNDHDERLAEEIKSIIYGKGQRGKLKKGLGVLIDSPLNIDLSMFSKKLQDKIFIETVRKSLTKVKWMPFEEAKKFVSALGIKNKNEYVKWCNGEFKELPPRPSTIPLRPSALYNKHKNWRGFRDFIGKEGRRLGYWMPYLDALKVVHALKLKNFTEYLDWCDGKFPNLPDKPAEIPKFPRKKYKEFTTMGDWLGHGRVADNFIEWPSLNKAKLLIRKFNLNGTKDYKLWIKQNRNKNGSALLPSVPQEVYGKNPNWKGFADFIGKKGQRRGYWMPYLDALKVVHALKLKNFTEYLDWCDGKFPNLPDKPAEIPKFPRKKYKEFTTMGDWLGNGRVANKDIEWPSFKEAKKTVQKFKFKGMNEYHDWIRTLREKGQKHFLPYSADQTYKRSGDWKGWPNFLGYESVYDIKYLSFYKAKAFVHKLKLQSEIEYLKWWNGDRIDLPKKPSNIPKYPHAIYKKEFTTMGDWLGHGRVANKDIEWPSFKEAKKTVQKFKFKGRNNYQKWVRENKNVNGGKILPISPDVTYKKNGWKSWGDFLRNEEKEKYLTYKKSRKFVKKLKLNSWSEYLDWCNGKRTDLPKKPKNIPKYPRNIYKNFIGMGDWLGYERVANKVVKFLDFKMAKKIVKKNNINSVEEYKIFLQESKEIALPSTPSRYFKNKGWKNWYDFLGKVKNNKIS